MNDIDPQAVALYGEPRSPRRLYDASAGKIQFVFEDGMIKHVRRGSIELIRRVYFAVRDDAWDTVYPVFSDVKTQASDEAFRATFEAECQHENVHYRWSGRIESKADGTIIFEAGGAPERDFASNRIGMCLLLPADTLAGQPFQLTKVSGAKESGRFSRYLDHDLVGEQFVAIGFQVPRGPRVECAMNGAVFDMEDQRLYMDTTYKAYAPLPHNYPEARAGEHHIQTFTMRVLDDAGAARAVGRQDEASQPVEITVDDRAAGTVPSLGLTLNALVGDAALTDDECVDLAAVKLAHLRFPIDLADDSLAVEKVAIAAKTIARITNTVLLSVSHVVEPRVSDLYELTRPLVRAGLRRVMIELCDVDPDLLPVVRLAFAQEKIDVRIGGPGSAPESSHPQTRSWALAEPDFLSWAGSAAIHQEDDETLMENAAGAAMQLESVRQINAQIRLGMGPFRLDGIWPRPRPTPRYTGRLAAAWLATAIKHLGEAGAGFATLFDATGPSGIFYRRGPFDQPGFDDGEPRPYPSGHVVAWMSGQRGRRLLTTHSSDPLSVQAMAVVEHNAAEPTLVLINQSFRPQSVRVGGMKADARIYQFANEHLRISAQLPGLAAGEYPARSDAAEPLVLAPYSLIWLRPQSFEAG